MCRQHPLALLVYVCAGYTLNAPCDVQGQPPPTAASVVENCLSCNRCSNASSQKRFVWSCIAGAAVLAAGEASCSQLNSILERLPHAFCSAAAALHAPASAVPLPVKLASCKLLALVMPTQELADIVLKKRAGNCSSLCTAQTTVNNTYRLAQSTDAQPDAVPDVFC